MQAEDARLVMSRKRRVLGRDDLLSIVRDLPKEERARLYEARQKTRARADTARARALGMSPSPAPQQATAAERDASQPEEGELANPAMPSAVSSHAATQPAQCCKSSKARNGKRDVVATPGAASAMAAGTARAQPQSTEAPPSPPPGCVFAPPGAAPEPTSERPADTAARGEAGEGGSPAHTVPTGQSGMGVAVGGTGTDSGTAADICAHTQTITCSSSG